MSKAIFAIEFGIWVIVGILVLIGKKNPTKLDYILVWACFLLTLIARAIGDR